PAALRGATMSSPDIRAGMAMLIAACAAHGRSHIMNTDMIARGYENLAEKFRPSGLRSTLPINNHHRPIPRHQHTSQPDAHFP
ncbi:MAG: hypothetical protein PHQ27_07115, partial [Victivallales bacterium]|nr:hypothetical protein [Victivallales bacterium]